MDLNELRKEIDQIDDELVRLFTQRMEVSARIADYKKENGLPILMPQREAEKLRCVAQKAGPELAQYTKVLYSMLFELSRGYQSQRNAGRTELFDRISQAMQTTPKLLPRDATVACISSQEQNDFLCRKLFGDCARMEFKNTQGLVTAVEKGLCHYGILPAENGRKQFYDTLSQRKLYIVRSLQTRDGMQYFVICNRLEIFPGSDHCTLRMALSNHPGALYKVLARLYTLGINVSCLESRAIPDQNFLGMFYFDLEISVYSQEFVLLICELDDLCQEFSYLGSYTEVV
jgi:monofunctional chorismate mutase